MLTCLSGPALLPRSADLFNKPPSHSRCIAISISAVCSASGQTLRRWAQVLLDELLTPGDLASDALADAALQSLFAAAASPGAAAGAAALLRRAAPSRRSLQALDAQLAASGGGALGAADAAALRAFVGSLDAGGALRDERARCLLGSVRRWHSLARMRLSSLCALCVLTSTAQSCTLIARRPYLELIATDLPSRQCYAQLSSAHCWAHAWDLPDTLYYFNCERFCCQRLRVILLGHLRTLHGSHFATSITCTCKDFS